MVIELDEDPIEIEITDEASSEPVIDEDAFMKEPFNPNEINIVAKQDTLRNIIERLKNNEIDMNTDFQRHVDLWDPNKMSRLIESILIRFPLPAFYFDATDDENWLVVDGLQRLSSIRKFIIEEDNKEKLYLRGLEYISELEGKPYSELPRTFKRRIDECPVTLFLIQPGTPDEVKYSIFRRINTGGLVLNNQEIRNAMAKPGIRKYLEDLAKDDFLIKTIGDQSKRMVDQELVLRFMAFHTMDYLKSTKNITTFLDDMMDKLKKSDSRELRNLDADFREAMKRCWEIFENSAFEKKTDNSNSRRIRKNSTLFEVWSVSLAALTEADAQKLIAKREIVQEKHISLMTDDNEYFRSITFSTQKKDYYKKRHEKVQKLIKEVLDA